MLTFILFIVGFYILIKGADVLVDGASSIAKRLHISDIVIGLTIVAFGTSMPELFVNLFSSINGNTDIAIGNIIGSNIANILLILGISAVVFPISVKSQTIWKEIPFGGLAVLVTWILAQDMVFAGAAENYIGRGDGLILVLFFVLFLYYMFRMSRADTDSVLDTTTHTDQAISAGEVHSLKRSIIMIVLGLTGLIIGGKWIVDAAVAFAAYIGLSQALIGLSIVAVGTSLPELATSVVAARKGNSDIAIGNVAGSNIFNIFWILGVSSIISPLPFNSVLTVDFLVALGASVLLFLVMFVGKKAVIGRLEGLLFILSYIAYVVYIVMRG
jgi:cation:H+ antiporter